jgi:hypothetical protein
MVSDGERSIGTLFDAGYNGQAPPDASANDWTGLSY